MQQLTSQHPAIFGVFSLALLAIFWIATGLLVSWITGWRSLAERYKTNREFPARKRWMQSARMRAGVRFNHALTLGSDAEGIYMGMTLPMFPGQRRLFIPWSDVKAEEPQHLLWLMMRTLRLGPDGIPLRVREPLAQFLLQPRGGMNATVPGIVSSTF
jgi:hypothetical protein